MSYNVLHIKIGFWNGSNWIQIMEPRIYIKFSVSRLHCINKKKKNYVFSNIKNTVYTPVSVDPYIKKDKQI